MDSVIIIGSEINGGKISIQGTPVLTPDCHEANVLRSNLSFLVESSCPRQFCHMQITTPSTGETTAFYWTFSGSGAQVLFPL